jgi:hypothetical protein
MNAAPKCEAIVQATGSKYPLLFSLSVAHRNELWLIVDSASALQRRPAFGSRLGSIPIARSILRLAQVT